MNSVRESSRSTCSVSRSEFRASHLPSRRELLWKIGGGLGSIALAGMLGEDGLLTATGNASQGAGGVLSRASHHRPRARRVVQLFMAGGASHLDLWDHKPALEKHHGQPSDFGEHVETFQDGLGPWLKSPWKFQPYGQCGKMLSDAVWPMGAVVDEIAFVHNLVGKTGVHSQATGFQLPGFPGWVAGSVTRWAA